MPATSEARILANRKNAEKSTGPKTPEGKAQSRRNGLKHGLTGSGVVLSAGDASEIAQRNQALLGELAPQSILGRVLVGQLATLSVRMERGAKQEEAAIATRVRHSVEVFDRERIDRAEQIFATLAEAPKDRLRELKRSPEGVDRLILAWEELHDRLTCQPKPAWNGFDFETMAHLLGFAANDYRVANLKAISQSTWGVFANLSDDQGAGLDVEARKIWARDHLIERIELEITALEAHLDTLDLEVIELDRLGAADVALFDPSREAALARRYEAEARRGFFKALHEFRKVEAEAQAVALATNLPNPEPEPVPEPEPLGSSWVGPSPTLREPEPGSGLVPDWSCLGVGAVARGLDGRVVAIGRGVTVPG